MKTLLANAQHYRVASPRCARSCKGRHSLKPVARALSAGPKADRCTRVYQRSTQRGKAARTACNPPEITAITGGKVIRQSDSEQPEPSTGEGNNGNFNNFSNGGGDGFGKGGGGGDGFSGDANEGPRPEVTAMLVAAGRTLESFPSDFAGGITSGKVTGDILKRFMGMEDKFILGWLLSITGFRERLLADPSFIVKVGIEVGIGICTKLSAEYAKRQDRFAAEADFVAANVMMALIADFMLVWLPAPTLSFAAAPVAAASRFNVLKAFDGCAENAFQKVQPGMPAFSLGQRVGAVIRNGTKLFGVGLTASFIGVAATNVLIALRQALDPDFRPLNKPQNALAMSAGYGVYMATSSNLRYQVLAGVVEERGIEQWFKGNYRLCSLLSLLVRTGNTFLGSLWWVDFLRLTGLQSVKPAH